MDMKSGILIGMAAILLLLALPAAASDFTLGVFGNANKDDAINVQDVAQIEPVILGNEKELTVLDSVGKLVGLWYLALQWDDIKLICCHIYYNTHQSIPWLSEE